MPTETTKAHDEIADLVKALPAHLRDNFEKAEARIKELYGLSPGVPGLMRLWIACGTSWRIQREFECAVLEISRKAIDPAAEEFLDDDCL
jgi:hypothetical protein